MVGSGVLKVNKFYSSHPLRPGPRTPPGSFLLFNKVARLGFLSSYPPASLIRTYNKCSEKDWFCHPEGSRTNHLTRHNEMHAAVRLFVTSGTRMRKGTCSFLSILDILPVNEKFKYPYCFVSFLPYNGDVFPRDCACLGIVFNVFSSCAGRTWLTKEEPWPGTSCVRHTFARVYLYRRGHKSQDTSMIAEDRSW